MTTIFLLFVLGILNTFDTFLTETKQAENLTLVGIHSNIAFQENCAQLVSQELSVNNSLVTLAFKNTCRMRRNYVICFADSNNSFNPYSEDIGLKPGYACHSGGIVEPGFTARASHQYGRPVQVAPYSIYSDLVYAKCVGDPNLHYSIFDSGPRASPSLKTVTVVIMNKWSQTVNLKYCIDTLGTCSPTKPVTQLGPKEKWVQEWDVGTDRPLFVNCVTTRRG
jgi:hypothetical protein